MILRSDVESQGVHGLGAILYGASFWSTIRDSENFRNIPWEKGTALSIT